MSPEKGHVVVVVLGDVGRSPRMQYHAASLLEEGYHVTLVGYEGEALVPVLCRPHQNRLTVVRFSVPSPLFLRKILPLYLLIRVILLFIYVIKAFFVSIPRRIPANVILVQNPPAMPLLLVAHFYCLWNGIFGKYRPALVIDWHNLGYTMISSRTISKIAKLYEQWMAPYATAHMCVTKAMKTFLQQNFQLNGQSINVLYDCPPKSFQPTSVRDQHELLSRLLSSKEISCPPTWYPNLDLTKQTLFTEQKGKNSFIYRPGRPALVTSSTSWTPDEDFGQLLEALVELDEHITSYSASTNNNLKLVVIVTGKGPEKSMYETKISKLTLDHISIQTIWLEPADYPRLLACADVGISLHTSTSGIDLPMKVLDLFGCQVPVCARNFNCLSELVVNNENGRSFDSSSELKEHLWDLLKDLDQTKSCPPHSYGDLAVYSQALQGRKRWNDNWREHALPIIHEFTTNTSRSVASGKID